MQIKQTKTGMELCRKTWRRPEVVRWLLVFFLLLTIAGSNQAGPGDLDLTFGTNGMVRTPVTNAPRFDVPYSLQVQPDGKILVGGIIEDESPWGDPYPSGFFLIRYNSTGTIDT